MKTDIKRKGFQWFSLIGILYFFCFFCCERLAREGNILWDVKWTLGVVAGSLCFGIISGCVFCLLLLKLCRMREKRELKQSRWNCACNPRKAFVLSWIAIVLCWIPAWLAYYPGICSYDTSIQMGQIVGRSYNNHHPLAHTLLLGLFVDAGRMFGSVTLGVGIHTLLQLVAFALVFAIVIFLLAKRKVRFGYLTTLTLFAGLFPVNWYMSVTTTKDVLFSGFVLLFFALCYAILEKKDASMGWHLAFLASMIGLILFRNNGKYALLVVWFFSGFSMLRTWKKGKKEYRLLFLDLTLGLLMGCLLMSGISKMLNAREGDKREMLSMPIQQLARTMIYHGGAGVLDADDNTMSETDKALVQEFLLYESYKNYRPEIADPVKGNTNTYVVRYRTADFIRTYLNLLIRYPGEFLNAVLAVNAGYLNPWDETHATINYNGVDVGLGYIQTRWTESELNAAGIFKESKWPVWREKLEWFAHENVYLDIPILRNLVAPGWYLWCYLLMAAWLLIQKRYKQLLPMGFVLGYYLTLFLGPTVQMRYLYPLMLALPFWAVYLFTRKKEEIGEN